VFCAEKPIGKNREHVLPYWLLEMTGSPSRVVQVGFDYRTFEPVRFAWSQFVMPACQACNTAAAEMEGSAKRVIQALTRREAMSVADYVVLLDWLDKVRVGMWLAYHRLFPEEFQITPRFSINSRIGKKDRLVAVYPLETGNKGLNTFGSESLMFNRNPSVFGLRISNLLLLNASFDSLVSDACGFPFPTDPKHVLDGPNAGQLEFTELARASRPAPPLLPPIVHRPSVLLAQPILQPAPPRSDFVRWLGYDGEIGPRTAGFLSPNNGQGALFLERYGRLRALTNPRTKITFDTITGKDAVPVYALIAQVYQTQNYIQDCLGMKADSPSRLAHYTELIAALKESNQRTVEYLLSRPNR
jgi:hypothetical protein